MKPLLQNSCYEKQLASFTCCTYTMGIKLIITNTERDRAEDTGHG